MAQAVIDAEIQIKSVTGDAIEVARQEVFDVAYLPQRCTQAIGAGRLGTELIIEDESDTMDMCMMLSSALGSKFPNSGEFSYARIGVRSGR